MADIDATITDQPLVETVQRGPKQIKMQHNEACAQLKDTLGRLAFFLRNEIPAIKAHIQSVEAQKQTINSTVPEEYRATCVAAEDDKLRNFEQQINEIETSCLYYLGEEHKEMQHVNKILAGGNGYPPRLGALACFTFFTRFSLPIPSTFCHIIVKFLFCRTGFS